MYTIQTIPEIEEELKHCQEGTRVNIKGYVDSSGQKRDLVVELLGKKSYKVYLEEDLRILNEIDEGDLFELHSERPDNAHTDLIAARYQLIDSKMKSIAKFEGDEEQTYRGADYQELGGNLATLPDKPGCLYLMRTYQVESSGGESKPAKGAVPRAKQAIISYFNLPTRNYIHTLCLADGKFDGITLGVSSQV